MGTYELPKREIKFRGRNKEKKIMVYNNEDNSIDYRDGVKSSEIGLINAILNDYRGYEIMQYTGMKDKNGKEVYEGDIVQFRDPVLIGGPIFKGIVKFNHGMFLVVLTSTYFREDIYLKNCFSGMLCSDGTDNRTVVIGNIFENP